MTFPSPVSVASSSSAYSDLSSNYKVQMKTKWYMDTERKLIDIWANILEEFDGKMMTKKKKAAIATIRLNNYVSQELQRPDKYTEKAVCNKIGMLMKKGKQAYGKYRKKRVTGQEFTQEQLEIDIHAAELSWPNFNTFYTRFKNHTSLGPGAVDDSTAGVTNLPIA